MVAVQDIPRNDIQIPVEEPQGEQIAAAPSGGILLSANATNGSDVIKVFGNTIVFGELTLL